jgi:hypothetical protein
MMGLLLEESKAKGRCPLEPRQRRSLWNPLVQVFEEALAQVVPTPVRRAPLQKPKYCGSKGAALRGGAGGSAPWPSYF